MINETQKRRLIGLIVLLAIVFALSELLPHNLPESGEQGVPSAIVPLATNQANGTAPTAAAPTGDSTADIGSATPSPQSQAAQAAQSGPLPAVDASAPPLPAGAAAPRPARPSAMPAEVSSMPSAAAMPEPAAAASAQPKTTVAKPAEAKPQNAAKADSKPAAQSPAPVLKLSQTLPSPSAKVPAPAPAPATKAAKPTPPPLPPVPPVPPVPRLATSVQAPPPPVAAGQARLWYVQIGSFADQGNAQTTLNLLQNIGFHGESKAITGSAGNALYRVRLGPFPSEAVAQQAFAKVSHQGYPQARVLSEASGKP